MKKCRRRLAPPRVPASPSRTSTICQIWRWTGIAGPVGRGAFTRFPVRAESARGDRLVCGASVDVPECPTTRRRPCRGDGRRPARSRARTPAWRRRTDIAAAAKRRGRGLACGGYRRLHQLQCRGKCTIGVGSQAAVGLGGDFRLPTASLRSPWATGYSCRRQDVLSARRSLARIHAPSSKSRGGSADAECD